MRGRRDRFAFVKALALLTTLACATSRALAASNTPAKTGDGSSADVSSPVATLRLAPKSAFPHAAENAGAPRLLDTEENASGDISAARAIGLSLLVPGLGDVYAGRPDRARVFFAAEAAIWTAFAVFRIQGHGREESYHDFAVQFAGITGTDHSDDFYSEIGQYDSSNDYEAVMKKNARFELEQVLGYEALERYYLEHRVADFEEWAWASSEDRIDFRALRSDSRLAYRRSGYMIALAAANRVVAALFAYQAVKSANVETGRLRLDFAPPRACMGARYAAAISLVRSF
jgi:hypothetical protein